MPKDLRTSVQIDTSKAERSIERLVKKINSVDTAMNRAARASNGTTRNIQASASQAQRLQTAMNGVDNAIKRANNSTKQHGRLLSSVVSKARMLAATYLGIMGMKALVNTSDAITGAQNKLNYMNASNLGDQGINSGGGYSQKTLKQTQQQLDKMFASAMKARAGYTDMISNVSKSMMLSGKAFNNNIDNAIRFQEIMSEAYTISGASQAEKNSSMYQLIQALGSGTLQGDELRSVREGAQMAYQAIEQFAQGVYHSNDSLKDMASQGKITSDIVVAAMLNAGDEIDAAFSRSAMTFDQAWTLMKNSATKAFEGMSQEMNKVLNSEGVVKMIVGFSQVLSVIGAIGTKIVHIFGVVVNAIAENWYWLKYIVYGVIAAITVWLGRMAAKAVQTAVVMFADFLSTLFPLYGIIIAIGIIIALMVWIAGGTEQLVDGIIAGIQIIVGSIFVAVSFVINLIQLIANVIATAITVVVSMVVNAGIAICNAIATIANVASATGNVIKSVFSAAFSYAQERGFSFVRNVANAILSLVNLINSVLGVFGIQVSTAGLESVVTTFGNKANEAAAAGSASMGNAKDLLSNAFSSNQGKLDYINMTGSATKATTAFGTAFEKGWSSSAYNAGSNVVSSVGNALGSGMDWISSKLSSLTSGGLGDLLTKGNSLNTDNLSNLLGTGNNPLGGSGGGGGSGGSGGAGGKSNTDKLVDNTDAILDTLQLTEDDLKHLYDLAELEWKKDFTTNRININMTNNNTVNGGEGDLKGLVTKLTDSLYNELSTAAGGVIN